MILVCRLRMRRLGRRPAVVYGVWRRAVRMAGFPAMRQRIDAADGFAEDSRRALGWHGDSHGPVKRRNRSRRSGAISHFYVGGFTGGSRFRTELGLGLYHRITSHRLVSDDYRFT